MGLGKEYQGSEVPPHHMISTRFTLSDVDLDHLVKAGPDRFLHCKVSIR